MQYPKKVRVPYFFIFVSTLVLIWVMKTYSLHWTLIVIGAVMWVIVNFRAVLED